IPADREIPALGHTIGIRPAPTRPDGGQGFRCGPLAIPDRTPGVGLLSACHSTWMKERSEKKDEADVHTFHGSISRFCSFALTLGRPFQGTAPSQRHRVITGLAGAAVGDMDGLLRKHL